MRLFATALTLVGVCLVSCHGQDLTLDSFHASTVCTPSTITTTKVYDQAGKVLSEVDSDPLPGVSTESLRVVVRATTAAAAVRASASDASRNPVPLTKVSEGLFMVEAGHGKVWVEVRAVDFEKQILEDEQIVVDTGEPEGPSGPDTPTPDVGGTLAERVAKLTRSQNDPATARTIAAAYRSVAGRAAGLSAMDSRGMLAELKSQLDQKLSSQTRTKWKAWAVGVATALSAENLGTSKPKHIKAFLSVASAIESATPAQAPTRAIRAPTPAIPSSQGNVYSPPVFP